MLTIARGLAVGAVCAALAFAGANAARADGLVLYGAGSLRETMTAITAGFAASHGIAVETQFGPSGRMRERIEAGARVDVFTSADVGHARKLVEDGRAEAMVVFARNTLCLLVPNARPVTAETALDRLLEPGVKLGVSPAKIDPLGDYTVKLLDAAEAMHPGSRAAMQSRSVVIDTPPGAPPPRSGDNVVDAMRDGGIQAAIVYCSGRARYAKLMPEAHMVAFPAALQVGPEYGLAVMKGARPEAALLALAILSPAGQRILAESDFKPVTLPSE